MFRKVLSLNTVWLWWGVLIFSLFGVFILIIASLYQAGLSNFVTNLISAAGFQNVFDAIANIFLQDVFLELTSLVLSAGLTISWTMLFLVRKIRSATVQALAYGYFENFLIRLIDHCGVTHERFKIVIVLPSFQLVEHPDVYLNDLKTSLKEMGFQTKIRRSDAKFGRNAFIVDQKDGPTIPLYIDIPTTLKTLKKILELEADMPIGRVVEHKWWRDRFLYLRNQFAASTKDLLPENSWGRVVFLDAQNKEDFLRQLQIEIQALQADDD